LPGPAPAPLVAVDQRRPGARRAADARVALLEERVRRQPVTLEIVEGVARRPRDERVHLHEPARELLDDGELAPRRRLIAPPPVDPGADAREVALERLDLVDVTAEVGVPRVEVEAMAGGEVRARHDRLELDEL